MISPGRLWWLLKRDLKRGLSASYHDYKIRPLIQKWNWPFWNEAPMSVPVHVLTGEKDWQLCAWMLASFFHYTEQTWNIVIHDDGTLTEEIRREFSALFKTARIIPRAQADATLDAVLKPLPFAYEYRGMHPLALKIFDMPYYCEAPRFIMLDSDVLFFNHPREIMDWAESGAKECWFNEDIAEGSLLPERDALEDLGVKLWPRVNSGLALITKEAIDYEFCDRALGETPILKGHLWRVEQTLFALCASRLGKGGLLPKTYEVSLGKHAAEDCVARHYVGAVRNRFFAEGMKRLRPVLLAGESK
ncbi:MAG: hypothetical protein ABIP20_05305 [Chthoniobacteraceae bacterium]